MAKGGEGKVSNSLVALSCAAVLAVYTAGYSRTREAAEAFESKAGQRRPASREHVAETVQAPEPPKEIIAIDSPPPAPDPAELRTEAPRPADIPAPVSPAAPIQVASTQGAAPQPVAAANVEAPVVEIAAVPPAPTVVQPAPAPGPEPPAAPPPPPPKWKDGTYTGWGTSRHGDIEARVVIKDGRIVAASVATCETRYSCDVIDRIVNQPVQLQSPDVDYVSRATESSDAYYYGLVEALGKARFIP